MYSYASGIIRPRIRLSLAIASGLYKTAMYMVYQGPTHLLCREKILQVLPKILHVLGKFVRIDNWSLYVWSHHKDSLGLVDGRQRLMMLVNKNDMANRIKLNSSASSKMEKNVRDSWTPAPARLLLKFSIPWNMVLGRGFNAPLPCEGGQNNTCMEIGGFQSGLPFRLAPVW